MEWCDKLWLFASISPTKILHEKRLFQIWGGLFQERYGFRKTPRFMGQLVESACRIATIINAASSSPRVTINYVASAGAGAPRCDTRSCCYTLISRYSIYLTVWHEWFVLQESKDLEGVVLSEVEIFNKLFSLNDIRRLSMLSYWRNAVFFSELQLGTV